MSQEYIEYLVDIANGRMIENKQRIDRYSIYVCIFKSLKTYHYRLYTNLNGILESAVAKQDIVSLRQTMSENSSSTEMQATASVSSSHQNSSSISRTDMTDDESNEEEDLILPWEQT